MTDDRARPRDADATGSTIKTRCVIWGGGLKAAPVAAAAGLPQGKGGRIDVEPGLHGRRASPACSSSATSPTSRTRTARPIRSSGRSRSRAAARPRRRSSPTAQGKTPKPFSLPRQGDDGDDRPRRRRRPGQGRRAPRQARVRGLARRPRRPDDGRQQSRRRVQELGDRLLRQGTGAAGARPERDAAHGVGRATTAVATASDRGRGGIMQRRRLRRHHHRQRRRRRDAGRAPRPVGQADPHPRARRLAAARDRELGRRRGLRQEPLRAPRTPGTTTRASRSSRASTTTSAARRSSTARRCTGSGREDFGELRHHDGISPAWPISYDELEPYYTRAEHLYEVHGNARRGPDRGPRPARRTRSRP